MKVPAHRFSPAGPTLPLMALGSWYTYDRMDFDEVVAMLQLAVERGVTLFDHTVFLLYSLTFVSLVFMALMLLLRSPIAGLVSEAWVLLWALPVHLFFQLKGGYALGVFSALWRTLVLMVFSTFCLAIFLVGVLAMGLLG